ncbi:hypothetical protein [Streptomyces sp. NBC_01353]|uniref:hypothetical protein n=1 Tax=Streptomyces sp. NBC_01353 TaxID=2903835 RepID=UPI002E31DE9E|nr:hypothetical protein [Streptomyces sp. NBC_01353]
MAPSDLDRLAGAAQKRRRDLGLALNDKNAQAAGTSKGTWQRVEKGLPIRATNYVKIDGLLEWAPGSCVAVLEGRDPVPARPMESNPNVVVSDIPPELIDDEARDVIRLVAVATTKGLTAPEIRELSDRVVRELREHGLLGG